ncbi:MAG: type II CRISPR RNA-guided endonuclease Cas9 [Chloroflexi bacterium]|nr:type II CRISPR RNA-guided endonuclease Cas9 [Chloroflexota bacterium]
MLRLGLDLGTNSIGWALYRLAEDGEPEALVDGGVLIHPDGRNPRNRASKAAERRIKRGPRRNRDRMLRRRRRVAQLLHGLGLLHSGEEARKASRSLDPLQLRAEALDRPLTPHELGRVLLSFAGRRGFKSNRKTDGREEGAIRKETGELRRRMEQAERDAQREGQHAARTLGEFLWRRRNRGETIRARPTGNRERPYAGLYPDRAMIEDELDAIRGAQAEHHPRIADEDWDEIIGVLLHQRRLRPVERGKCTLLPDEPRAFRAYPLFQRFRIRQEVRNLEVETPGDPSRPLADEERERLVAKLLDSREFKLDHVAAFLGLPDGTRVNLRSTARDKIDGDLTAAVLRAKKCFGRTSWARLSLDRQQELVERLIKDEDHERLVDWLRDEHGLSEDAAEAASSTRLPQGTGNLSKAAIERLLPHMSAGQRYDEAVEAAGLGHHSDMRGDGKAARLPYYGEVLQRAVVGGGKTDGDDTERWGRIANPTVHIALGQVRQLFNAIAKEHGKPGEVVVELARELKQNEEQRLDDQQRQRDNRERNERLRELAEQAGHEDPSPLDMRKLRLWEEQGPPNARLCPFTGEPLSVERVLSAATEIEHLLPYSRSLDNSMNNTVVAMRAANREKGNRTPFEAWGHDRGRFDDILDRARLLPFGKQWRFDEDAMERWQSNRDFLDRQLNENSYLSRLVREYLEAAVAPNRIWVTPGRMTAMLRRGWGLNSILSGPGSDWKNRDDHRHHLVDAAVVGMTSRSLLQKVARASGRDEDRESVIAVAEQPWEGFRHDVGNFVERCIVRHRPDHFTVLHDKQARRRAGRDVSSGSLHNDTAYGIVDGPDENGYMTLVETKPLDALNPKKLATVRDLALRSRLCELWERVAAEGSGESATVAWRRFTDRASEELRVRRVRVLVRLGENGLAFIRDRNGRVYKAYKTDGNAYMDIWLLPKGRKTTGETVSRFNAHQPDFRSPIKAEHPTARKLMRLQINDMIAVGEGDERRLLRVQFLSGQKITAVDHNEGGDLRARVRASDDAESYVPLRVSASRVIQAGLRKVSVDVLGRVQDGGPFGPDGRGRIGRS